MSETLHKEWLEEIGAMLAKTKADGVIVTTVSRREEDPSSNKNRSAHLYSHKIFGAIVDTSKAHGAGIN